MSMDVNASIVSLLKKKAKDYLTIVQIKNGLSIKIIRALELNRRTSSQKSILAALRPHLLKNLMEFKGSKTSFIGYAYTIEKMILRKIAALPTPSTKKLRLSLPYTNQSFIRALNLLLKNGIVACELNEKTHLPQKVFLLKTTARIDRASTAEIAEFENDFKQAYQKIGKGRSFVRIHKLREELGWSAELFDFEISRLKKELKIQLQSGDPSLLSEQERLNSYRDEKGRFRITLTWIGHD